MKSTQKRPRFCHRDCPLHLYLTLRVLRVRCSASDMFHIMINILYFWCHEMHVTTSRNPCHAPSDQLHVTRRFYTVDLDLHVHVWASSTLQFPNGYCLSANELRIRGRGRVMRMCQLCPKRIDSNNKELFEEEWPMLEANRRRYELIVTLWYWFNRNTPL